MNLLNSTFLGILCLVGFNSSAQIFFQESATTLGLNNSSYGMGFFGAGVAFYDFDQDGWDDITMATEAGMPVRFFRNIQGVFSEDFFISNDPMYETKSITWVDINNDGELDLFVTSESGENRLYKNTGNMNLVDITASSGLALYGFKSWGASWGDINNDGFLDVFISCRDIVDLSIPNFIFLNNGDDTFTNINTIAGIPNNNYHTFCVAFIDFDKDGLQDIYTANDKHTTANNLYKNNGNNTFTDVAAATNSDFIMDAMSTTIGDYNNDGWLDIYITNTASGNVFAEFDPATGTFTDIAASNGTIFNSIGWGAIFVDADNDTDLDLYVSGSMVQGNYFNYISAAFYENDGLGIYSIPSNAGFQNDNAMSFANALGDIDNDGKPDMVVLNFAPDDLYLWRNQSNNNNNWIKIKLQGTTSNYQGIGSWIEVSAGGQSQHRYTLLNEGYLGQNSAYEFVGLGTTQQIDYIKVQWLSGVIDSIPNPPINQHLTIVEGSNTLSIQEFEQNNRLSVFPNPAKDIVHFSIAGENNIRSIVLRDMKGSVVQTEHFDTSESTKSLRIKVLKSGLYIAEVLLNNHEKRYSKILIE
ncbi:MAG: FG-GAP-like repeat-containing protein [Flavobacteriaceae bacterium]|nr:FG-GAP-like repeat-containing protein [Flavobacteriaceae bacterium]